jgi:multidrug efflux pump subunit AcrB
MGNRKYFADTTGHSSGTKTIAEIQDQALFKPQPMFSSLPEVSAPPPFGGSERRIVIRANPDRLRAFHLSPDNGKPIGTQETNRKPIEETNRDTALLIQTGRADKKLPSGGG